MLTDRDPFDPAARSRRREKMQNVCRLIEIDDFYSEPMAARQKALEPDYPMPEARAGDVQA